MKTRQREATGTQYKEAVLTETEAAGSFQFVGSNETVDRMGDIIRVSGWELDAWKSNPVILWAHNHRQPPVGKGTVAVDEVEKRLVFEVEFPPEGTYDFADSIRRLVEAKFIRAVSVGMIPKEYEDINDKDGKWTGGFEFKKQELLELSIVSVPANPDALSVLSAKQCEAFLGKSLEGIDALAQRFVSKKVGDIEVQRLSTALTSLTRLMEQHGRGVEEQIAAMKSVTASINNFSCFIENAADPDVAALAKAEREKAETSRKAAIEKQKAEDEIKRQLQHLSATLIKM